MGIIRCATYNCKNFRGTLRCDFINDMFKECDFLCIQEHWLLDTQFHLFDNILCDVPIRYEAKSPMELETQSRGRPYGGVAIIWRSNLKYRTVPIKTISDRLCCIQIWLNDVHSILLFCVYMPCDDGRIGNNLNVYQDILSEISTLCSNINATYILLAGDLNTDLSRSNSLHTKELLNFCTMENISSCHKVIPSIPFTFESGNSISVIDHILISDNLKDTLKNCYTIDYANNGSDHLSLVCYFDIPIEYLPLPSLERVPKVAWYKASLPDIEMYKANLDIDLDKINVPNNAIQCTDIFCDKHSGDINQFYLSIIDCCINASESLPSTSNNKNKLIKAGWNDVCKERKNTALFWHSIWKSAGSPKDGYLANIRRSTRAIYHRSVKILKKNQNKLKSEKMASALISNTSRNLWSEVRKFKGKSTCIPHNINGTTGDKNIANEFANKFKTVFNSVGCSPEAMSNVRKSVDDILYSASRSDIDNSFMDPSEMKSIIKDIKSGKSDGNLGLYSNHILNGTDKLFYFISLLFNCMLVHGISPDDMRVGTMVSIPKGKRLNLGITDNFRGICLQSLLCKVLDLFMLHRERHNLSTSNMQFGFKECLSSSTATAIVTETIDYYQNNGGAVYALALDATKAFDRVEYSQLFEMLISRGFNPLYIRLLLNMYINQTIRVKFSNEFSDYFSVSNGVKQGGIISPTLFTCYIDDMLNQLKSSKIGCHCGHEYVGCISYADDLILLAPNY